MNRNIETRGDFIKKDISSFFKTFAREIVQLTVLSMERNCNVVTILAKNNWNTFPLQHANKQSKSKTTSPKYQCRFKNFDPLPPYNVDLFSQYFHTAFSEEIFTFRIKTAELNNIVMGGRGGIFQKKLQLCTSVPTILARIVGLLIQRAGLKNETQAKEGLQVVCHTASATVVLEPPTLSKIEIF